MTTTAVARRTDPETSHEAAGTVDVMRSQMAVLTFLRNRLNRPFTYKGLVSAYQHECQDAGYPWFADSRIRSACKELRDAGLIRHVGFTTPPSGRRERVWEVTS